MLSSFSIGAVAASTGIVSRMTAALARRLGWRRTQCSAPYHSHPARGKDQAHSQGSTGRSPGEQSVSLWMKIAERAMPEQQRVLARLLIVVTPHGFDTKPEALVERARRFVRSTDLECRTARSAGHGFGDHRLQQSECEASAPPA